MMNARFAGVLGGLRGKIRAYLVLEGIAATGLAVAAGILASFLLDWLLHLPAGARGIVSLAVAAWIGVVAFRWLVRRGARPLEEEDLALVLEKAHPEWHDRLISAIQIEREMVEARVPVSRELAGALVAETERQVAGVTLAGLLDGGRLGKRVGGCAAALGLLVALAVAFPSHASAWAKRNLLLRDVRYPQRTYLIVEGYEKTHVRSIPRGDPFEVRVRVDEARSSRTPDRATIRFVYLEPDGEGFRESGGEVETSMSLDEDGVFRYVFESVVDPVRFWIEGGDDERGPYRIAMIERPRVETFTVDLTHPEYTRLAPEQRKGETDLRIPYGTEIAFTGRANRKVVQSWLAREGADSRPVVVTDEGLGIAFTFTPEHAGIYALGLVGADGLESRPPLRLSIRFKPDRSPRARLELLGIGEMITPWARLPMRVHLDDDYGVRSTFLRYEIERAAPRPEGGTGGGIGPEEERDRERSPEGDRDEGEDAAPEDESGGGESPPGETGGEPESPLRGALPLPMGEAYPKRITDAFEWHPASVLVEEGDLLVMQVIAEDADDLRGPNRGESASFAIRVVSAEELLLHLARRQQELHDEFARLIDLQVEMSQDFQRRAIPPLMESAVAPGEALAEIATLDNREQQLLRQVEGRIRDGMVQIIEEMKNNKVADATAYQRLWNLVVYPLNDLVETQIPELVRLLHELREDPGTIEERPGRVAAVDEQYKRVIGRMRIILEQMSVVRSMTEIIASLEAIRQNHGRARELTEEARRRTIERVLRGD